MSYYINHALKLTFKEYNKFVKHCRDYIDDDIMYMNKWYHSHLSEQLLYYPSVVMTLDGVRNIAGTKSYGFIIIYTSDDYTPLPTRYRRMIL